jgi:hypothetical protein
MSEPIFTNWTSDVAANWGKKPLALTHRVHEHPLFNGLLRTKVGITPKSTATSGAGFWAKAAMQAVVRRAGLLEKEQKAKRAIEFKLDSIRPGAIIDLAQAAE